MHCVFWFSLQLLSEKFLILRKLSEIWSKMCSGLHVKYPLFVSDFHDTWICGTVFSKKTQIPNFAKIRPVRAELFHADGRTDRHDEANCRFSQFCERSLKHIVRFLRVYLKSSCCMIYTNVTECFVLRLSAFAFNPLAPEFFFILAHPVCKMWIIQNQKR
jgi:hypothetical protein